MLCRLWTDGTVAARCQYSPVRSGHALGVAGASLTRWLMWPVPAA